MQDYILEAALGILGGMTLLQVVPIKIDPWSWIARQVGRAINGEVLKELENVKAGQRETQAKLDNHVRLDDERNADTHRTRILQFNTELLRGIEHTREDFIEILSVIDLYERYCHEHPEYQNNRAVHAIANIGRIYDDLQRKRAFLV